MVADLHAAKRAGNLLLGLAIPVSEDALDCLGLLGSKLLGQSPEVGPQLLQVEDAVQVQLLVIHHLQSQ